MKIKLENPESIKLLDAMKETGTVVDMGEGRNRQYLYFPYWICVDETGVYMHSFESLPKELKDAIEDRREGAD